MVQFLTLEIEIFIGSRISKFLRPAQRYSLMILNLSHNIKTEQNCCCPHCRSHHFGYSVPRHIIVLFGAEAPSAHVAQASEKFLSLVLDKYLWPRPEQYPISFLRPALPMAPTTDNNARDERKVLRPNPATFLRDFTLYKRTL